MSEATVDALVLGAGAAGMMCAIHAAARGGRVLIIDHARKPGEKIRISGGGRCNFTNLNTTPQNFISGNPHFAKSALKRYTQHDFTDLVRLHGIAFHEKTLGQLFCDGSATEIIDMLLAEMAQVGVELRLQTSVNSVTKSDIGFDVELSTQDQSTLVSCRNFVVACGGKSIPKMGATGFGYRIAEQFGLAVTETRAALVPLTFSETMLAGFKPLAGVSADAVVSCGKTSFAEALLFTHRGLSGPAILQISSYWRETMPVLVDLLPGRDVFAELKAMRKSRGRKAIATVLGEFVPNRLAAYICEQTCVAGNLADLPDKALVAISAAIRQWQVYPVGTEGYRTAEVTLGGVDTDALSSRSMQARDVPGLYFIGEVVDVTGWLGGYNFQWAWSSGWAAGTAIAESGWD
ncbi:aminoacetone oxidase family FAD-binding enzyme [Anderseniella sp. Alg231-50]|uniref:aminoacetone oxidase family FAD-binding enzyme n=1 Tax=Anderseniella sp. Alg231-50 TaxID=1922226 RepID=UPI000D560F3B